MTTSFLFAALLTVSILRGQAALHQDEQILFFPTIASQVDDHWILSVRGWVREPEDRRVLGAILQRAIGIDQAKLTDSERAIYRERTRHFLPDNERGKLITVQAGTLRREAPPTAANGHFKVDWKVDRREFAALAITNRCLAIAAVLATEDSRAFIGTIHVLSNTGISVISDIDDTIKISKVRDREALLANTFCRPFKAAPGMAELYREWEKRGAQFHYVSASPWQLYIPLAEFVSKSGFPQGTFHMKDFRVKDSTFLALFSDPQAYKLRVITPLLTQFPKRRFILVGDSGEKDPEIYGLLARTFPKQVATILIRNVTDENRESERYKDAFQGVPFDQWIIFKHPNELQGIDLRLSALK